jgi:hypothetical protein
MLLFLIPNPLEESEWLFPVVECFHILGFALSAGTIAIVDFCLLGAGPKRENAAILAQGLAPWTLLGLADMLFTGPLLYLANGGAAQYGHNPAFRFKLLCLLAAIVYQYTLHRKLVSPKTTPSVAKLGAVISLCLWTGVVAGGLFIAFTGFIGA